MVINMKKSARLREIVLPNKRINFFVMSIIILGIISGSIFLMMLSKADKDNIILQVTNFFVNVSKNNIDKGQALKNSLIINYIFVFSIWVLGFSVIGIIVNIFFTYLKGFLVGFTVSSIFLTYKYKGFLAGLIYVFPSQVINILVIVVLSIYSIMFTNNLIRIIVSKSGNNRLMFKKYCVILVFSIIFSFISSLFEVYVFPYLLKIIINIYM